MTLQRILEARRESVAWSAQVLPESQFRALAESCDRPPLDFRGALSGPGVSLVAEVKRRSPSAGVIRPGLDVAETCRAYVACGAAAVSVLAEPSFFGGRPLDFTQARATLIGELARPLLWKDFVLSPYQVYQARVSGADAVLLIAACLAESQLAELMALVVSLKMQPLVEVHSRAELEQSMALQPPLLGINNRDLRTFTVSLSTTLELAPLVAGRALVVSESGIRTRGDVLAIGEAGASAVLVGEALLRSSDIEAKARELLGDMP